MWSHFVIALATALSYSIASNLPHFLRPSSGAVQWRRRRAIRHNYAHSVCALRWPLFAHVHVPGERPRRLHVAAFIALLFVGVLLANSILVGVCRPKDRIAFYEVFGVQAAAISGVLSGSSSP